MKKFPNTFHESERIVRHVYSPQNINPTNQTLKANFVQFQFNPRTEKNELSCNRFEFDSLENCRLLGKINARPPKAEYFGLACTSVKSIKKHEKYVLAFTPILDYTPPNYFHCDIYDLGNPPIIKGEALSAKMAFERSVFIKIWNPFWDDEQYVLKEIIQPPEE